MKSTDEFCEALTREGELFLGTALRAGLAAEVPTCPGWRVRDLVRHLGHVHRWATGFVADGLQRFVPPGEEAVPDGELADWYASGHRALLAALAKAPEDLECWTFLPGPATGRRFWARRQAHETAIHRMDAQAAAGEAISPVDAEFAEDGIDELVTGFHGRPRSRVRRERPGVLRIRASDRAEADWTVAVSAAPPRVGRTAPEAGGAPAAGGRVAADCEISGPAAVLYPALWNRPHDRAALTVRGERELADLWASAAAV
ncbi:maleylpyruvate isomerase family mycothiol-dependent enzyme [Streptomyces hoynatensis]|uniref:Maleylpyruvate isomerase family mycothiol-dependent enzyme n=1 Tax=Streptomyces hoynatensis TaxID=1141874 RepID=A0A3A9YRE3_9ACTN|nr:maleylpyruvate isomerase family mycothiol-dependent enzyme [Streptomyces hoynatensis]RKN38540.1 maleylpyruvate isomerase family mycothiol-dependent enzyme [Streptomyces hoynatensis]